MPAPDTLPTPFGLEKIEALAQLPRHRHNASFLAVVFSGGYLETGDAGRFRVGPGDVLVHAPYEAHRDQLSPAGATILNLPCPAELEGAPHWQVADPDGLHALAAVDPREALAAIAAEASPCAEIVFDWPDLLARSLRELAPICLAKWAEQNGLAPETVSRSFARAYGVTPHRYRAEARARRAVVALRSRRRPLATIAADLGFSDQAHMSRAVRALSGRTPGDLRRRFGEAHCH